MFDKIKLLITVSRPLSYFLVLIFLAGLYDAKGEINLNAFLQLILFTFPTALFTNGINDIFDHETDKINPRKNNTKQFVKYGKTLATKDHPFVLKSSVITGFLVLITTAIIGNLTNTILVAIALVFAYFYSAPPLRLKNHPPFDIFSILIPFLVYYLTGYNFGSGVNSITNLQLINLFTWSLGLIGFVTLSNMGDYQADKDSGVKNTVVKLGLKINSWVVFGSFLIASIFVKLDFKPMQYYIYAVTLLCFTLIFKPTPKHAAFLLKTTIITYLPVIILYVISLG